MVEDDPSVFGSAQTPPSTSVQCMGSINHAENHMYIGGGVLGTVLVVLLVLWLLGKL
jgi:hypothetical protein